MAKWGILQKSLLSDSGGFGVDGVYPRPQKFSMLTPLRLQDPGFGVRGLGFKGLGI